MRQYGHVLRSVQSSCNRGSWGEKSKSSVAAPPQLRQDKRATSRDGIPQNCTGGARDGHCRIGDEVDAVNQYAEVI